MFAKHYARYYESFNRDKNYKKEVGFVYKWAEKPIRILDVGCGTANYWKYFPTNTHIAGIEKSQDMVNLSTHKNQIICQNVMKILDFWPPKAPLVDAAIALFDVMNYIPMHRWWKHLPLKPGGFFIFDIWDKEKVDKDKFSKSVKMNSKASTRTITPLYYRDKSADLEIEVNDEGLVFREIHHMHVYSKQDIESFCGKEFEIVEVQTTKTWQTWWKLRRR